jgi:hypothetical protein
MFKIPFEISQNKEQTKLNTKNENKFIFDDKIVNRTSEPTLFNVQAASTALRGTLGTTQIRSTRREQTQDDMVSISIETLHAMNVGLDSLPADFSLLEDNNPQINVENPNIFDEVEANNVLNSAVSAKNNFPSENDPVFQLDDGNFKGIEYSSPIRANDFIAPVDPSTILSNLNILNQSDNYFGKNKYYK